MLKNGLFKFADKINEIMPVIIQGFSRRQSNELYEGKITLVQFLILNFLSRKCESRMTDIARFMQVTTPAMTGIVARLVRDGYAVRIYDPKDRRIIKIRLTAKAGALVKKINQQRRKTIINVFGNISADDRENYLRILMQITDILSKGQRKL